MIESIEDYRKIVIIKFWIRNDNGLLTDSGFLKDDINRLCKDFKNILLEKNEEYLDYIKNEEQSTIEKFLNK